MKKPLPPLNLQRKPSPIPVAPAAAVEVRSIYTLLPHPKQEHYFPAEAAADLDSLAANILANGLLEKIEITPENVIVSGHRRLAALVRLELAGNAQFEDVEVLVRYDLAAQGEDAVEHRLVEANLDRRHLTPIEFARTSKALLERCSDGKTKMNRLLESIARKFGVSRITLERSWSLLDLPIELQRIVDRKELSRQLGQQLLDFATPDEIEELRQVAVEGGSVKKRAKQILYGRLPAKGRKPPTPEQALKAFETAIVDFFCCYDSIAQHVRSNLQEREVMVALLGRLRLAELAVPLLLEIVCQSPKLEQDVINLRPTLERQPIDVALAGLRAKSESNGRERATSDAGSNCQEASDESQKSKRCIGSETSSRIGSRTCQWSALEADELEYWPTVGRSSAADLLKAPESDSPSASDPHMQRTRKLKLPPLLKLRPAKPLPPLKLVKPPA